MLACCYYCCNNFRYSCFLVLFRLLSIHLTADDIVLQLVIFLMRCELQFPVSVFVIVRHHKSLQLNQPPVTWSCFHGSEDGYSLKNPPPVVRRLLAFMLWSTTQRIPSTLIHLNQGWAIFSLPRAALAIHVFVEGRRKN
jgi:hypothetical protein